MTHDELLKTLNESLIAAGGSDLVHEEEPGPLGTTIVTARARAGMYPGANIRTAVLDGERAYAATIGPGLGMLLRDRGVAAGSVEPLDLLVLQRFAALDGRLVLDSDVTPTRVANVPGVVIRFASRDPMSGRSSALDLVIPMNGPIEIVEAPDDSAAVLPINRAVGLERALADGDAFALLDAVKSVSAPLTDAERSLLARVAATPNETIAYEALTRLDASEASAAALRSATADAEARARVVALATSAFGADFARGIGDQDDAR